MEIFNESLNKKWKVWMILAFFIQFRLIRWPKFSTPNIWLQPNTHTNQTNGIWMNFKARKNCHNTHTHTGRQVNVVMEMYSIRIWKLHWNIGTDRWWQRWLIKGRNLKKNDNNNQTTTTETDNLIDRSLTKRNYFFLLINKNKTE